MFGIFIAILVFAVIILIHEFGHFIAARKFKVKVEEFGLGLPPRAKKLFKDKKGTLFSLNWIPFGGFVKITGEMPLIIKLYDENKKLLTKQEIIENITNSKKIFTAKQEELNTKEKKEILEKLKEEKADYNLMNKPAWQQSIILLAGVFMNFVLAFFIFTILFFVGVKPIGVNSIIKTDLDLKLLPNVKQSIKSGFYTKYDGVLLFPIKNSVAEKSGIKNFDYLIKINSKKIIQPKDVIDIISKNKNKIINLKIKRLNKIDLKDEKTLLKIKNSTNIINLKIKIPEKGKIGTYLEDFYINNPNFKYKYSLIDSIKYGFKETINQTIFTFQALKEFARKIYAPKNKIERKQAIDSMSGPVGIVNFIKDTSYKGIGFILILAAIISINLGVMNLLPIPALDGGRFFIIVINEFFKKLFKRKLISNYGEAILHSFFFIILLGLIFYITYNDIEKIIK